MENFYTSYVHMYIFNNLFYHSLNNNRSTVKKFYEILTYKIQPVGQKNIETKHLSQVKARLQSFFTAKTLQIWRALFATSGL